MEKTRDLTLLFFISAAVLLWHLGSGSICSWDEGIYGGIAKEILETGDWINLHWMGMPWSDKPPLYMWVSAVFIKIFGYNEFSVRLFSAISGIGTVLLTYFLGNLLYSRKAAVASSLALLTSYHFIWSAKMGMLDITLTFFITASFLFFLAGEKNRALLFLCPVAFGLAFMTKGTGAMIVPFALIIYILFSRKYRILADPYLISGTVVALFFLFWWHWAIFSSYGMSFIKGYFFQHLVQRTTTSLDGHTGDFLTYFGVIPNKGRPWAILGMCLIPVAAWRLFYYREKQHLLPVIWFLVVFIIFSAVKTKLHWYIIPVYPAISLLSGWAIEKIFRKKTVLTVYLLAFASVAYLSASRGIFNLDYSPGLKQLAVKIEKTLPKGDKIYMYAISDPGVQFYLEDRGENIRDLGEFQALLRDKNVYAILNKEYVSYASGIDHSVVIEDDNYVVLKSE